MRKKLITMIIALTTLITGCNKEDAEQLNNGGEFGAPSIIDIKLVNNEVPSKAPSGSENGTDDENRITSLEFYVFDGTGAIPDPEVGRISEDQPGKGYIKLTGEGLSLNQKIRVSAGTNKKMLVLANVNLGEILNGESFEALKARISTGEFKATTTENNTREISANGLEMSGYSNSVTIEDKVTNNQVYITMRRLVSKINTPDIKATTLQLKTIEQIQSIWGEETEVDLDTEISFEFKGFAVVNGSVKSTVAFTGNSDGIYFDPENSPWDMWTAKSRIGSTFNAAGFYTNNYSGKDGNSWFLSTNAHTVYLYENKPESIVVNGISGYDLKSVYALIIEGKVSAEGEEAKTRYWRVDLTKDDVYHFMRNCVYKVTINSITTPGYGTPKEAEEKPGIVPIPGETAVDFIIKVAQWDINEYQSEM